MKQERALWMFGGFALTSLGGTLLHFLYDWTEESVLVAPFSAVNESTWEHMKLLYFPLLVFALVQRRSFGEYASFWCVKLLGIVTGLLSIPVLFYAYNGAFGKSPDWLNITIFFIAAATAFLVEAHAFYRQTIRCKRPLLALGMLLLIGVLFMVFTFAPLQIPLFQDPTTRTYGI